MKMEKFQGHFICSIILRVTFEVQDDQDFGAVSWAVAVLSFPLRKISDRQIHGVFSLICMRFCQLSHV